MIISAVMTNTLTNALHVLFLFAYFISSTFFYLKKDPRFTLFLVLMFLTLLCLKILGVYVHYYPVDETHAIRPAWIAIDLLVIFLNYLIIYSMQIPDKIRILIMFLSILSALLFITENGNFTFIAAPSIFIYFFAAYYSSYWLRIVFTFIACTNIGWIIARNLAGYLIGHPVPIEYRYDNDVYHILLIIGTFSVYACILKGYWRYPIINQ